MRSCFFILVSTALLTTGCGESEGTARAASPIVTAGVEGDTKPWTELGEIQPPGEFRFAVVSDRTGEHRDGVFASAMPKINLVAPDFVVSVGDLIEGYSEDAAILTREWDEMEGFIGSLDMPFFYAAGNHDMSNELMALEWQRRFGPSYYSFEYENVLFLILNSELFGMVHEPDSPVPGPWAQADQLAFVERVLGENAGVRHTFVVIHQPVWDLRQGPHPDWLKVESMLGERAYTVFAGHTHDYTTHIRNDRQYITLATTGGGSRMRGIPFGEFDHVAHVTMTADGPVIANLMLDGIHDSLVRTEDVRSTVRKLETTISSDALLGTGDLFRDGVARFTLSNSGTAPIRVSGRFEAGRDIEPLIAEVARTVPAGGIARVEVPYHAPERPVPYDRIAPARAHWTLQSEEAGAPVEIEAVSIVHPERRFAVNAAPSPVAVDGDLADWSALPFVVAEPGELSGHGPYRGAEDASFRFGIAHDEANLYIAVDVTDDSVVAGTDLSAREQDSVNFSLDARPDPERSENTGFYQAIANGSFGKIVTASVTLEEPRPDPIMALFGASAPEGLVHASKRTDRGYTVEFSVPVAALDAARGADWDALRVNVGLADFDAGEPDHSTIWWRANRFGGKAPEGSGVFQRR